MGIDQYIFYSPSQLQWLDFISTDDKNYFLFPQTLSIRHSDFQFNCEINGGVFYRKKDKTTNFYIGYFDDESEISTFRPLFEVPEMDWNWSGGGFRINFNTLIQISIKKELNFVKKEILLYELL
jgi:hypothetical protein